MTLNDIKYHIKYLTNADMTVTNARILAENALDATRWSLMSRF